MLARTVSGIRLEDSYRFVTLNDGTEIGCKALIIATGVSTRKLEVAGAEGMTGAGIYYGAALTEAAYYRDKHMCVIGGANSAGQGAMFFARYASQVSMLVRGSALEKGMSQYLVDQIYGTENIDVQTRTVVSAVHGTDRLQAVTTQNTETGEEHTIETPAMFVFIGAVPHTEMAAGIVERNSAGFVLTGPDLIRDGRRPAGWKLKRDPYLLETSVPGIFAAGDVRQGAIRRVASAVGQGANAVNFVHQYLRTV